MLYARALHYLHVLEAGDLINGLIERGRAFTLQNYRHVHEVNGGAHTLDFVEYLFKLPAAVGTAQVLYSYLSLSGEIAPYGSFRSGLDHAHLFKAAAALFYLFRNPVVVAVEAHFLRDEVYRGVLHALYGGYHLLELCRARGAVDILELYLPPARRAALFVMLIPVFMLMAAAAMLMAMLISMLMSAMFMGIMAVSMPAGTAVFAALCGGGAIHHFHILKRVAPSCHLGGNLVAVALEAHLLRHKVDRGLSHTLYL